MLFTEAAVVSWSSQASHNPDWTVFSLGQSEHGVLDLPHLIVADCLETVCGIATLQVSFRDEFRFLINLALVSSVPLKMQLCLLVKGQTVHQPSMITNMRKMMSGSGRGASVLGMFVVFRRQKGIQKQD